MVRWGRGVGIGGARSDRRRRPEEEGRAFWKIWMLASYAGRGNGGDNENAPSIIKALSVQSQGFGLFGGRNRVQDHAQPLLEFTVGGEWIGEYLVEERWGLRRGDWDLLGR